MNTFGKISLFTAGIMYPTAVCIGSVVAWHLKVNNPDNVDITAGLAYLRPTLVTSFTIFAIFFTISLATGIVALKKETESGLGKFALLLLSAIVVLSIGTVALTVKTDSAEEAYRIQHSNTKRN